MNKLKNNVVVVAPTMFSADYGGATRIIEHIKALKRLGFSIDLHAYAMVGDLDEKLSIRVKTLPFLPRFHQGAMVDRSYLDVLMALQIAIKRNAEKPNFIISYNQEAAIISKFANKHKVPVVMDVQGILREELRPFRSSWVETAEYLFERKLFEFPSLIVASSPFIAEFLRNQFGVRPDKMKVLLDSVDTELFANRPKDHPAVKTLRSKLGIHETQRVVLYIGTFSPLQGTDILLDIAKYVLERERDLVFVMAGGRWTNNLSSYVELAKKQGILSHLRFLPGPDYVNIVPYLLNLADVAVAPKQFSLQSHGKLAVLMSAGLPAVVWDNPINRVFLGSLGVYAKDFCVSSFGEAIISTLNHTDRSLEFKLRERAVKYFSLNRLMNDMLCISKMLTDQNG